MIIPLVRVSIRPSRPNDSSQLRGRQGLLYNLLNLTLTNSIHAYGCEAMPGLSTKRQHTREVSFDLCALQTTLASL